jgi:hypothetical protein
LHSRSLIMMLAHVGGVCDIDHRAMLEGRGPVKRV